MASLFGSVASRVGEGMIENAKATREEQEAAAERLHEQQLVNMRLKADRTLQQQRLDAEVKRDSRRREYDAMSQDLMMGAREKEYQARIGSDEKIARMNNEWDALIAMINLQGKKYTLKSKSSGSGAYDLEFETLEGGVGPEGFEPARTAIDISGGGVLSGRYIQEQDKLIPFGKEENVNDFGGDKAMQRATEDALLEGMMTDTEFFDRYGYLPKAYVFKNMAENDTDAQNFIEQNYEMFPTIFESMKKNRSREEKPAPKPEATGSMLDGAKREDDDTTVLMPGGTAALNYDPLNEDAAMDIASQIAMSMQQGQTAGGF